MYRYKFAYTIGRHNTVQHALQNQLREAGLNVDRATVHELRSSPSDRSQKQADLLVRGLPGGTAETLIDVGVRHSLIGIHINLNKPEKSRGANANDYARRKDRRYKRLLESAALPYDYSSFIVETYGAWGNSAIRFRDRVCNSETHPRGDADHNAWNNPDPKRSFTLAIAFAIQRGNIRMIQRAAARRASNRRSGLYSSGLRAAG